MVCDSKMGKIKTECGKLKNDFDKLSAINIKVLILKNMKNGKN